MAFLADVADAHVTADSDDEAEDLIPNGRPMTRIPGGGARTAALALSLVAGVALTAAFAGSFSRCVSSEVDPPADVASAVGLAERREAADERAREIVRALDSRPAEEVKALVGKALRRAGEEALARVQAQRGQMVGQKTFHQVLADEGDRCTLQRPEGKPGEGTFLSHDGHARVHLGHGEKGAQRWKVTPALGEGAYELKAVGHAEGGPYLTRDSGSAVGLSTSSSEQSWRIYPLPGEEDLYIIEAVEGAGGKAYLSRRGPEDVRLAREVGESEAWKVLCTKGQKQTVGLKTFNQVLADVSNQCTLQRPEPGVGTFLSHGDDANVYLDSSNNGPQQWKVTPARGRGVYNFEAIAPAANGAYLAYRSGLQVGLSKASSHQSWKVYPFRGKNDEDLYVIEAVGAGGGKAYLSREGLKKVRLARKVGESEAWKIQCVDPQSSRRAQRRATCAINIIYATQYVARSSLMFQAAARTCPNSKGLLLKVCAINALVVVASISNLALSLSNAASSCAESSNIRSLCASGVEALVVALSTVGAGGVITATSCRPGLRVEDLRLPEGATPANLGGPTYLGRRLFLGGGRANFAAQCVLDFTQVAWSLGSVGLAITAAARDSCPSGVQGTGILVGLSQAVCSMDVAAVVYAIGRISLFLALATIHCTDELNLQALCAGGVSALVAAAAALVVSAGALHVACDQGIDVVNAGGTVPLRISAGVEASASRRLLAATAPVEAGGQAEVREVARSFGYNVSTPLELPTFEGAESAARVLRSLDQLADEFGVGEASLRKRFKSVEDLWRHVGFNVSDVSDVGAVPAPPAPQDESKRFVELMQPLLREDGAAQAAGSSRK